MIFDKHKCRCSLRRVIGVICSAAGFLLLIFCGYLSHRIEKGREKISRAEEKIEQSDALFGFFPYTKELSQKIFFNQARQQIQAGKRKVSAYEIISHRVMILGITIFAIGITLTLPLWKTNRTKRNK